MVIGGYKNESDAQAAVDAFNKAMKEFE